MDVFLESLLLLQTIWLVLICPFTKVEESFNLQAIHDVIYHGNDIEKYDHHEFPGVVPRTFIGPLSISVLSYPLVMIMKCHKLYVLYLVRIVLGVVVTGTLVVYSRAIRIIFGPYVSRFLCVVTITQFHFLFYSSRPLPNTFALALVLIGLRFWLLRQHIPFIWVAGAAIIIFRFELSILFGLILVLELVSRRLGIEKALFHIIPAGVTLLGLTIFIDSYFWRRWVWPEGEVLWFNTIMNKSSQWGTSPIWWYFTSALPRSLLFPLFMIPWGAYMDRRTLPLLSIAVLFVGVYSLLPHKELRFIIYTVPMLNTVAAAGYANIWRNRSKFKFSILFTMGVLASLVFTAGLSHVFLTTSIGNYPGGHAFRTLHKLTEQDGDSQSHSVHIGVEAAMTGVSRFGETQPKWNYSKIEGLPPNSPDMLAFDFLLISIADYRHYDSTHDVIHKEVGFSRLALEPRNFPPVRLIFQDRIYILKRKNLA